MSGATRASDEVVTTLSKLCNERLLELYGNTVTASKNKGGSYWFMLFNHVDADGSGRIDFAEFRRMTRLELGVSVDDIDESSLKAIWLVLDRDASGHITSGEFGAFMRKGSAHLNDRRERHILSRKRLAAELYKQDMATRQELATRKVQTLRRRHESAQAQKKEKQRLLRDAR